MKLSNLNVEAFYTSPEKLLDTSLIGSRVYVTYSRLVVFPGIPVPPPLWDHVCRLRNANILYCS